MGFKLGMFTTILALSACTEGVPRTNSLGIGGLPDCPLSGTGGYPYEITSNSEWGALVNLNYVPELGRWLGGVDRVFMEIEVFHQKSIEFF